MKRQAPHPQPPAVDGARPSDAPQGLQNRLDFRVLGPLRVLIDGTDAPIVTRQQRALLVLLLMNVGRVVPTERLIDQLWDGSPPPQGAVTLRSYVSNLRQALGGPDGHGTALVTRGQGYSLDVPPECVDATRFTAHAEQGREHLRLGRPAEALTAFEHAVRAWEGDPLAEIADHEAARSTITQLTETYLGAVEGRFEALLALGRHADALPGLEAFTAEHPLREEPRALQMLALYRAGRAAESLGAHRTFRALLQEELGIDPSRRLDDLQQRILENDATLAAPTLAPLPEADDEVRSRVADAVLPSAAGSDAAGPRTALPAARGQVGQTVIVGRARELAHIDAQLEALTTSHAGSLLLVSGEPGIGKSTLLEKLEGEARRRGVSVHAGRSPAATGAPAFWPWLQVVESLAAGLDDDTLRRACAGPARPVTQLSASIAERTGQAAPVTGDNPQTMRFLLYEAVSTFLRQAPEDRPVVITLDDLQWADLPSLELLSYLTPGLATQPMLLVAAYRNLPTEHTEELDATLATVSREDVAHELALGGISQTDVADLMDALVGEVADPDAREPLVALLHERTGGNPFFVRQLARLLLEDQQHAAADAHDRPAIDVLSAPAPPGVRHVVARRLAALPDTAQDLLAAAAVVGRDFDLRVAARAAGLSMSDALDAFDEASRHGLVETCPDSSPGHRFVHALVQEVAVDALPPGRAARLHASVADELQHDGSASPDELARHLWAARDLVGAAAVPALVSAAEAASAVFALEQAEMHLRHALHLVRTDPDADPSTELSLLLSLFRLLVTGRGWGDTQVRAVADRALELAQGGAYNDDTSRLWWTLFFFLLDRNEASYVDVADRLLDAIGESPSGEPLPGAGADPRVGHASRAAVHMLSVFSALHADDRIRARTHLRTARSHVDAAPQAELAAYDEHLHVMLLLIEGTWAALTGDQDGYRSAATAAVALADADGRPFPRGVARTLAAAIAPYLPDVPFAADLARQSADLNRRFGFAWLSSVGACVSVWADALASRPSDTDVQANEAQLADVRAAGRLGNEGLLLILLADLYGAQERFDAAREALVLARANPGPYRGLVVDVLDARLRDLA